jgi:hypothetical protein
VAGRTKTTLGGAHNGIEPAAENNRRQPQLPFFFERSSPVPPADRRITVLKALGIVVRNFALWDKFVPSA